MYCLNKIIGWLTSPLGLCFGGLALAWLLPRIRPSERFPRLSRVLAWSVRNRRRLAAVAVIQLWIFSCGLTTRLIGVPLEGEEISGDFLNEPVEAIVVLGGGIGIHEGCGRVELFSAADRVWTGVQAWKRQPAVPLVLGGGMDARIEPLMRDFGVPRDAWSSVAGARNTEEEARQIREAVVSRRGDSDSARPPRILLVTSAWHLPRATTLFERAGFAVVPGPADYEMHLCAERPVEFGDFFPSAEALQRNSYALKEWVARAGYWLKR